MLKRIALSLLIVVFVVWSVVGSWHGSVFIEICEKTSGGEQNCASYDILSYVIKSLDHYSALITAIATLSIAAFTWTLWLATDKLREAGDRQAELTRILERAYISAKPLGINPYISEHGNVPDRIVGHIAFINVGRLPARNVSVDRAYIKWSSSEFLQEDDLPVGPVPPMTVVLPPGTEMRHGSDNIPANELDKPGYLYVWGRLEYTDGFGVSRHTRFCHRYPCLPHKSTDEGKSISRKHARYHQHGNDAD